MRYIGVGSRHAECGARAQARRARVAAADFTPTVTTLYESGSSVVRVSRYRRGDTPWSMRTKWQLRIGKRRSTGHDRGRRHATRGVGADECCVPVYGLRLRVTVVGFALLAASFPFALVCVVPGSGIGVTDRRSPRARPSMCARRSRRRAPRIPEPVVRPGRSE